MDYKHVYMQRYVPYMYMSVAQSPMTPTIFPSQPPAILLVRPQATAELLYTMYIYITQFYSIYIIYICVFLFFDNHAQNMMEFLSTMTASRRSPPAEIENPLLNSSTCLCVFNQSLNDQHQSNYHCCAHYIWRCSRFGWKPVVGSPCHNAIHCKKQQVPET